MKNSNANKPRFKDSLLWALKIYGASWLSFLICSVPLYIFRGLYKYDETRIFWENVLMSILGTVVTCVILFILSARSDEFERAEKEYVKKLAIRSGIIYGVACFLSLGNYFISVIIYHMVQVFIGLFGIYYISPSLIFSSAFCNILFGIAISLGAKKARKRREKYREELLGENKKIN